MGYCLETLMGAGAGREKTRMTQKLILRHGDCVAVLGEYEEGSVGGIVCDPPYG